MFSVNASLVEVREGQEEGLDCAYMSDWCFPALRQSTETISIARYPAFSTYQGDDLHALNRGWHLVSPR